MMRSSPPTIDQIRCSSALAAAAVDELDGIALDDRQQMIADDVARLEAMLPDSCTTLESAHRHLDLRAWRDLCTRSPLAAQYDADLASQGRRTPLLIKMSLIAMIDGAKGEDSARI